MKPDLRNIRKLTHAELTERRKRVSANMKPRRTRPLKYQKPTMATKIRTCVFVPPELKLRAKRDLGQGNFTRAVIISLNMALAEFDARATGTARDESIR